jgi:hypothetical protein
MQVQLRRLLAGLVVVLVVPPSAALATDGTYTHVLCANPDTGAGVVGANGKLPDGTTNPWNVQFAGVSASRSRCSGPADGSSGVPVTTGGGWSTGDANRGGALSYRVPAPLVFGGGVIYRYGTMSGRFSWTVTRHGRWDHMYGQPNDDHCAWGDGCYSRGTSTVPFGSSNRVVVRSNEINGFDVSVLCDIPSGWSCSADGSQTVRVYGGKLTLEDRAAPVPGGATGSLASEGILRGVEDVDFSATDSGSGLYRVRLLLNGVARLSRIVHDDGGRCADVNPANGDAYEFAFQVPCRTSASVSSTFDTSSLPEGPANVRVVVEDAGGNDATVLNRNVTIDNVPPPSLVSDPSVDGVPRRGSSLAAVAGSWDGHGASTSVSHQWQRCGRDGSGCVDVAGADGATFVLGSDDVGRRMRVVETASSSEGRSQAASVLTEVVTLEDGTLPPDRDGVDNDGDGEVDEPGETGPPPAGGGAGSGSGGHTDNPSSLSATRIHSSTSSTSSTSTSSTVTGAVNGEGASARARLTVEFAGRGGSARTLAFARAATAVGRLVDEHGRPIRNAVVDVASVAAVRGARAAAAQPAVTGPDGAFTYRIPARSSSRTLRFEYRYQREGEVVTAAVLTLRVRAAVRLAVRLRGVAVRYSGRVLARPLPRAGKLVVLQGRVRGGRWQTFATRRASRAGTFRGRYRLKVRRPGVRLQFRARAVAEAGWPYLDGTSRAVTRRVK